MMQFWRANVLQVPQRTKLTFVGERHGGQTDVFEGVSGGRSKDYYCCAVWPNGLWGVVALTEPGRGPKPFFPVHAHNSVHYGPQSRSWNF